ncbi:MAG: glycosyltransferase family 1 protein [Anaerolineaceae bacterium]|nr:glycosyltransferase family 1 protein [Anaerolineaceae bacterium]
MKIFLVAFGSHGDVQPILSLGQGLRDAGYHVTLAAGMDFQKHVERAGLIFTPIDVDIEGMMNTDIGKEWLDGSSHNPRTELANMKRMAEESAEGINRSMLRAVTEVDADVLISGLMTLPTIQAIGRTQNKRVIASWLTPFPLTRSGMAGMQAPLPGRYSIINRWAGYFILSVFYSVFDKITNQMHQQLGLPHFTRSDFISLINQTPSVSGFSEQVVPRPADWGPQHHITGYWHAPAPSDWEPSPALKAFLEAGDAPIYIGFGSMANKNPQATVAIMIEALQKANKRGIILSGWGGLKADDLPESIFSLDYAPHSWLFPRMAGVIHHGGAGTTSAALRAGVPSMIVAHMGDQPYWGRRIKELGVGAAPIRRHKLTVDTLAKGIIEMTSDPQMRQRAADLGARLQAEDGVAKAVATIGQMLDRK